jgi:hypothetical protein
MMVMVMMVMIYGSVSSWATRVEHDAHRWKLTDEDGEKNLKKRRAVLRQRRSSASLPYQDRNDPTMKLYNRISTHPKEQRSVFGRLSEAAPYHLSSIVILFLVLCMSRFHRSALVRCQVSGLKPPPVGHTPARATLQRPCALALPTRTRTTPHDLPPPLGYTYFRISIAINE